MPTILQLQGSYVAAFDGSIKTSDRFGAWGAIIWLLPEWKIVWASSGALEDATVNLAEYQGAISVLKAALRLGIQSVYVFGDSKLVIHQALDWMQCKQPRLQGKLKELRTLEKQLLYVEYHHVLRRWNGSADHLATMGMLHRGRAPALTIEDLCELQGNNLLAELLQGQEESEAKKGEEAPSQRGDVRTTTQTTPFQRSGIWAFVHPKPNSTTVGLNLKIRLNRISRAQDREKRRSTLKNYLRGNFDGIKVEDLLKASKEAGSFEIGEENALYRLNWSKKRSPEPQLVWLSQPNLSLLFYDMLTTVWRAVTSDSRTPMNAYENIFSGQGCTPMRNNTSKHVKFALKGDRPLERLHSVQEIYCLSDRWTW